MRKVVLSMVTIAFALSLGVGTSVMFPQKAMADYCIDVPGTIWVKTTEVCWLNKDTEGVIYRIYDGIYDGSGGPCLYLRDICWMDYTKIPGKPNDF